MVIEEKCASFLCYLLFCVVTMCSNFQATFPLISRREFEIHQISAQKSDMTKLLDQHESGFEKKLGDDVVNHVRHL